MAENENTNGNADRGRRVRIPAARKMLGMIGRNYSDAEVAGILDYLYGFAEEAYDRFENPPDDTNDDAPV